MKLTTAEEEIMQILWELGEGTVRDVLEKYELKNPAYNTVSTLIKILEKKNYVNHKTYGNTHVFYPIVQKEEYAKNHLSKFIKEYFDNSFPAMASFFAKNNNISIDEFEEILEKIKKESGNQRNS
jgi:BlaI family transcriptional regulator, penicillinase repressor